MSDAVIQREGILVLLAGPVGSGNDSQPLSKIELLEGEITTRLDTPLQPVQGEVRVHPEARSMVEYGDADMPEEGLQEER